MATKWKTVDEVFGKNPGNPSRVAKLAAEMMAEQDAVVLSDLRRAAQLTQTDMAERLSVSQNRISQIELADLDKTQVDTLRNYIEALGGELILGAFINGEVVVIRESAPASK